MKKKTTPKKKPVPTWRIKLGWVGVDTAQLLIIDPCYLSSQLPQKAELATPNHVLRFWGQDADTAARKLIIFKPQKEHGSYVCHFRDRAEAERARTKLNELTASLSVVSSMEPAGDVYWYLCNSSQQTPFGGQLNYIAGHAGLGVLTKTGFGDGCYEVWATIGDFGDLGERVMKIEIEFIPLEDDDGA